MHVHDGVCVGASLSVCDACVISVCVCVFFLCVCVCDGACVLYVCQ